MPQRSNNRIEVDLKLLQDRNIEKLLDFGSAFDASIGRLADSLKQVQQNLEEGGGSQSAVQNAGRLSPNASTGVKLQTPGASPARTPGQFYNDPTVAWRGFTGSGSVADENGVVPPANDGSNESLERQYVRASKRIGSVPVGLRQTLGYIAEGQLGIPGIDPESALGQKIQSGAGQFQNSLFTAQAIAGNAQLAYGHLQQGYQMIQGPTMLGQQLGMSREGGIWGTGLGSAAFNRGVGELWSTARAADFGFNANYSMAQARNATQAAENYGYSVSTPLGGAIANQLKQLNIHQGLDPNQVMDILDPFVRFGGGPGQSATSLIETLRAIPSAANAASMNLKVFTKDLIDTATGIAQSWGVTPGQITPGLQALSATTGIAPSALKGLYDTNNIYLAAALSGEHISQIMNAPKGTPGGAMLKPALMQYKSIMGKTSAQQLEAGFKRGEPWALALMDKLDTGQLNGMFFGLSAKQLLNMDLRNGGVQNIARHTALTQQLETLNPQHRGSVRQMQSILNRYGGDLGEKFEKWRQQHEKSVKTPQDLRKYRQQAQNEAETLLGKKQKQAGRKAAVEVELGPEAKKYFQILGKWAGQQDVGNRNQKSFFGRAVNGAKGVLHYAEDHPVEAATALVNIPLAGEELGSEYVGPKISHELGKLF